MWPRLRGWYDEVRERLRRYAIERIELRCLRQRLPSRAGLLCGSVRPRLRGRYDEVRERLHQHGVRSAELWRLRDRVRRRSQCDGHLQRERLFARLLWVLRELQWRRRGWLRAKCFDGCEQLRSVWRRVPHACERLGWLFGRSLRHRKLRREFWKLQWQRSRRLREERGERRLQLRSLRLVLFGAGECDGWLLEWRVRHRRVQRGLCELQRERRGWLREEYRKRRRQLRRLRRRVPGARERVGGLLGWRVWNRRVQRELRELQCDRSGRL